MKNYIVYILILFTSLNIIGQDKNPDHLIDQLITKQNVVGASAGYSVNGKIVWQSAAGLADLKNNKAFKLETKVRMASIAKPMTALAIMQLVEQGLIDLDKPIQTYIPDYPKHPRTQITTRHLLSHTSGIDGYKNVKEAQTKTEYPSLTAAVELFKKRKLLFEPGTKYSYTSYGYTVLGVIIERVTGLDYEAYMQKNIWDKAGMKNTGVVKYEIPPVNASELYHRGKKKTRIGIENNLSNRIPGGGFYTNVGDMLKFGDAVLNNVLVKENTLSLMRQHHSLEKENNAYGFGWFLYNPKPNEGAIIGHTGGQTGCSAQLFIVPSRKVVAITLANTSGTLQNVTIMTNHLMNLALK